MAEDSVAQDQIKAFVDRILRLKGEVKEINADVREIYAEAKGNGFDKTVLGKLVSYVEKRQDNSAAVEESETIFDLYLTAYDSAAGKVGTVRATHTHASEEDPEVTAQKARLASLRADPAMSIVDPANLKQSSSLQKVQETPDQSQPLNQAGQTEVAPAAATPPVESEAVEISTPIQLETANENPVAREVERPVKATEDAKRLEGNVQPEGAAKNLVTMPERTAVQAPAGSQPQAGKSVEAPASVALVSKYGQPGVITWERNPPEGVRRHEFSQAFGDAGQDSAVIEDDLANAASAPIVKIGNEILDGWARYMTARNMDIEYPVVQYDGSDPLIDCIRWNFQGRMLNSEQTFRIAQKLSKLNPKRKADIYAAFELGMELA